MKVWACGKRREGKYMKSSRNIKPVNNIRIGDNDLGSSANTNINITPVVHRGIMLGEQKTEQSSRIEVRKTQSWTEVKLSVEAPKSILYNP